MVDYHMFCEIKRLYTEKKLNSNQIGKVLGIDQKTAARWIRRERFVKSRGNPRISVLAAYKKRIQAFLDMHPYTAQQIFDMLKDEGFKGSYSVLSQYVSTIRPPTKTAYLTLTFEPGEAAQVDFAYCGHIQLEHTKRKFYAFIMTLCHSRMMFVEFIYRQNKEHFLQCHRNAFEYFGGVPKSVMVDNCKVAVLEHSYYGDIKLNPAYLDFAQHYGFKIKACKVRCPNEKGQVEKAVDYLKRNFLNGRKDITSLEAVNNAIRQWMENTANVRKHKTTQKKPVELFETEKKELQALNIAPYDCADIRPIRADNRFRVTFEANRYSVPSDFASTALTAKIYPDRLLLYLDNNLISEHRRSYDKNQDFENPEHLRKILEYKKNAKDQKMMQNFLLISPNAEIYYAGLKQKRCNTKDHIRKIMALAERYGREKISDAINDALELEAFSSEYIANLLEQRGRFKQLLSPLHLTRNSDCLEIELEQPDLNFYSSLEGN
jgi:transposase